MLDALPLVDVLLPNLHELLAVAGSDPLDASPAALERAAQRIRDLGPLLAVKAGAAGGARHHRPAPLS